MTAALCSLRKASRSRRDRSIRRIVQQSGTSCGIAAMAMLVRLSFKDAFRVGIELWGREYWEGGHRTEVGELRVMLAAVGWKLGRQVKCKDWRKVPPGSLVAVQWKQKVERWHWVVSDQDDVGPFFCDPRAKVKANRRRDFQSVPLAWYHRVRPL